MKSATATAENIDTTTQPPQKVRPLPRDNLKPHQGGYVPRNRWTAYLPDGADGDAIRDGAFWKNVADHLKRDDEVTCITADGSQQFELICDASRPGWAEFSIAKVIKRKSHAEVAGGQILKIMDDGVHKIEFRGDQKWCVVRIKDGHVMHSGYATMAAAEHEYFRNLPRKV